jgi:hypothetical protein
MARTIEERIFRKAFPDDDFNQFVDDAVPMVSSSVIYNVHSGFQPFLALLLSEANDSVAKSFEISGFLEDGYLQAKICIFRHNGLHNLYCALPLSTLAPDEFLAFPISPGTALIAFDPSVRAKITFFTEEFADLCFSKLFDSFTKRRSSSDIIYKFPKLAPYRLRLDYRL